MNLSLIDLLGALLTRAAPGANRSEGGDNAFTALLEQMLSQSADGAPKLSESLPEQAVAASGKGASEEAGEPPAEDAGGDTAPEAPQQQRAVPVVELPEAALTHATHSNGAPFEPYRTAEATASGDPAVDGKAPPASHTAATPETPGRPVEPSAGVQKAAVPVEPSASGTARAATVAPADVEAAAAGPAPPSRNPDAPQGDVRPAVPGNLAVEVSPPSGEGRPAAIVPVQVKPAEPPTAPIAAIAGLDDAPAAGKAERTVPPPAEEGFLPIQAVRNRAARALEVVTMARNGDAAPPPPVDGEVLPAQGGQHRSLRTDEVLTMPRNGAPATPPPADGDISPAQGLQHRSVRAAEVLAALKNGEPPTPAPQRATAEPAPAHQPAGAAGAAPPPARREASADPVRATEQPPSRGRDPALTFEAVSRDTQPAQPRGEPPANAQTHPAADAPTPVRAGERMAASSAGPAGRAPVAMEPVAQTAVHHVRHLVASGEQTVVVKLVPESLGELHITVRSAKDALEIVLTSSNHQVRQTLEHQLHALRETLVREGIDVTKATVTVPVSTDNDAQASFARPGNGQPGGTERHPAHSSHSGAPARDPELTTPNRRSRNPHDGRLNILA